MYSLSKRIQRGKQSPEKWKMENLGCEEMSGVHASKEVQGVQKKKENL